MVLGIWYLRLCRENPTKANILMRLMGSKVLSPRTDQVWNTVARTFSHRLYLLLFKPLMLWVVQPKSKATEQTAYFWVKQTPWGFSCSFKEKRASSLQSVSLTCCLSFSAFLFSTGWAHAFFLLLDPCGARSTSRIFAEAPRKVYCQWNGKYAALQGRTDSTV